MAVVGIELPFPIAENLTDTGFPIGSNRPETVIRIGLSTRDLYNRA